MPGSETPHPPSTDEFGAVTRGGPAHRYPPVQALDVTKLSVGPYDNNVYVLSSGGEAVVVDGAEEPERVLAEVDGLRVRAIVQTHGHADHVGALERLVGELAVPVRAHPADARRMPVPTEDLGEGDTIDVGGLPIRVLHTPGHTRGSLCFVAPSSRGPFLFSGDTLFPGGPGATDGDPRRFAQVMTSLGRLFALPDGVRVCPGHGLDTFIGRERPHLETWRARGW